MSNSLSPSNSRPVEQLRLGELRDELSENGLSSKRVNKEVLENLLEASKKEDKDNACDHKKQQEEGPKLDVTDKHEEFEGKGELMESPNKELLHVSRFSETANAILNNSLPGVSGLGSEGATLLVELQGLSVLSAPDGVPRASMDREECHIAGSVETKNGMCFVSNAVHENGHAEFSPENAQVSKFSAANARESGKDTCMTVCDTSNSEILENFPNNLMPDVKVGNSLDIPHEQIDLRETSDPLATQLLEKFEPDAEEVDTAAESNEHLVDQQCTLELLSKRAVVNSIQVISSCSDVPMTETVDELPIEFVPVEAETPSAEEICTVTESEMANVKSEDLGKHEDFKVAKEDKCEMEVEVEAMERVMEVPGKRGHESRIVAEDLHQQKNLLTAEQMKMDGNPFQTCEDSKNKMTGVAGQGAGDIVDSKPAEGGPQAHGQVKRDIELKQQEPAKRMRRWGSGNRVVVDTLEPLTSGQMNNMRLPNGSKAMSQGISPKLVATTRSLPPKVKADSETNGNTRIVPPSDRAPSNSLKIERFIRPFTLKAVKDMLAEYGECTDFWMDQIKTHCFVSYSSVEEAVAARNGLYGRQWPPSVGNFLTADYADSADVKMRLAGMPEKIQSAPALAPVPVPAAPSQTHHVGRPPFQVSQPPSLFRSDPNISQMPSFSRRDQYPPGPPEPSAPTLDDLFFKTKSRPHIYYLPLTKEQVAEKSRIRQAFD